MTEDRELFDIIRREEERQNTTLQLIASENFTSRAVMAATGSVLTNKYSEGYPGKRYYGGNHVIDEVEELARRRACELFGAEHANVQPHSGANANLAVYLALLEPGDTVLGMRLDQGGHLTHGSPVNISGRFYHFVSYGVTDSDERLDLDQLAALAQEHRPEADRRRRHRLPADHRPRADPRASPTRWAPCSSSTPPTSPASSPAASTPTRSGVADIVTFTTHKTLRGPRGGGILCTADLAPAIDKAVFPGLQGGPLEHVIAAKAVAFGEAAQPEFRDYAAQIVRNAQALAAGLAAEGFRIVSGGTDNHLMLVDLRPFDAELTGKVAQEVLDRAGITLNKNQIPGDPRSPFVTSGLRIGTPAVTTAGMGEAEMAEIARLIGRVLRRPDDPGGPRGPRRGRRPVLEVHAVPVGASPSAATATTSSSAWWPPSAPGSAPSSCAGWRSGSRSSSCPTTAGSTSGRPLRSAGRRCSSASSSPWPWRRSCPGCTVFRGNSEPIGVVLGAVGDLHRRHGRRPPGDVAAGQDVRPDPGRDGALPLRREHAVLPGAVRRHHLVLSADLIPLMTVLWVVGMANAVNLIDGLDGLAAGIVAIAAGAFFLYSHQLFSAGTIGADNSGPLVAVISLGLCVGFLPHNFHPARIFMGDAGAMLLGLLMAASTMSVVGQTDQDFSGRTYFFFAPLFIPFFILGDTDARHRLRHHPPGRPAGQPGQSRQEPPPPPAHAARARPDPLGAHPVGVDGAAVGPGPLSDPRQPGRFPGALRGSPPWSWPCTPSSAFGARAEGARRTASPPGRAETAALGAGGWGHQGHLSAPGATRRGSGTFPSAASHAGPPDVARYPRPPVLFPPRPGRRSRRSAGSSSPIGWASPTSISARSGPPGGSPRPARDRRSRSRSGIDPQLGGLERREQGRVPGQDADLTERGAGQTISASPFNTHPSRVRTSTGDLA